MVYQHCDQCGCEFESQAVGVIAMRYKKKKKRILEMLSVYKSVID